MTVNDLGQSFKVKKPVCLNNVEMTFRSAEVKSIDLLIVIQLTRPTQPFILTGSINQ